MIYWKILSLEPIGQKDGELNADLNQYQIMQVSPSTFKKLFGSNILASGASIYCTKEVEFLKNRELLNGWRVEDHEFLSYFYTLVLKLKS